jgi:flagellin-like hook-associated protein FlgL
MRVTNSMIFTNSVNNIFRNARHVNDIVQSIESTKRFQRPSGDPILSGRAMRYRTFVAETGQFIANASNASSWMEVTENALMSILTGERSLMNQMTVLVNNGATSTNELSDRLDLISEIKELFEQMTQVEMNQTHLGRYVFSGFQMDQPPVLTHPLPNPSHTGGHFVMQHNLQFRDLEQTIAFHRPNMNAPHQMIDVNIFKLPYNNLNLTVPHGATGVPDIGIPGVTIVPLHSTAANAYRPPLGSTATPTVHFLHDTGEIVVPDDLLDFFRGGATVTFSKNGFEPGELNPIINFQSWDITNLTEPKAFNTITHHFDVEISVNSLVRINSHGRNVVTPQLFADFKRLIEFAESLQPSDPTAIRAFYMGWPNNFRDEMLEDAVENFISTENQAFREMLYDRFNNMILFTERHAVQAQRELTSLGTRMDRLDLFQVRLEENEIQFTALLSETEDTHIPSAIHRRNAGTAAFQDALRAIAMVNQLALADFINR